MKAAFQGSYSDLRFVKSRSVAQIVIELPIEEAAAFVAAFGAPVPGSECPVAIARILPAKAISDAPKAASEPKTKRRFNELPLPQQAALLCQNEAFVRFLTETRGYFIDDPAETVRAYCGVESRKDILPGTRAGNRFLLLVSGYDAWFAEAAHV